MKSILRIASSIFVVGGLLVGTAPASAGTPIQIQSVSVVKRYPTFIVVKVTSKNMTSRTVQLRGYLNALDKNGYTTYQPPSFNEINMYGANRQCTGDMVNGSWPAKRSYSATWCFSVPKGKTIKSIFISANIYGDPMISKAVNIKN